MIPLIARPKLLSFKNRWTNDYNLRSQFGRDFVIGIFSILVMISIYLGMITTLSKLKQSENLAYLHPSVLWGIILLFLLGLLLFSNSVAALGALFLGKDLDLVIASPVSKARLYWGKLFEIMGSSTWMVLVFGFPALIAFERSYEAGLFYYLSAFGVLLPYFVTASGFAIILVTVFTSVIPANRTREILILAGGLAILGFYFAFRLITADRIQDMSSLNDMLYLLRMMQFHKTNWFPSYWAAVCLGEMLEPTGKGLWPYIGQIYGVALIVCAIAFLVIKFLHAHAYSISQSGKSGVKVDARRRFALITKSTPFFTPQARAFLTKELGMFLRDMSQTIQLMLLLGLCTVYLYNLRILRVIEELPEEARIWWQAFLVIGNMAMGAFVIAAVCTRFVFPSISLEGRAYWIIRSAPVELSSILRAKFWIWLIPVASIGSVLLVSGAFAISADPHIIVVSGIISWIVCYGIVGLGVGLGALYANFTWENTSQLAASFGSLIYMISSTVLIAVNLVPTTLIILMRSLKNTNHVITSSEWYIGITSCSFLLMYLNYTTARWALKIGEEALREMER